MALLAALVIVAYLPTIDIPLIAEYHITASWCPSWTAKNAAAQNAARRIRGHASANASTSHVLITCSPMLTAWQAAAFIPATRQIPYHTQ